jgi:hypothetical protein
VLNLDQVRLVEQISRLERKDATEATGQASGRRPVLDLMIRFFAIFASFYSKV